MEAMRNILILQSGFHAEFFGGGGKKSVHRVMPSRGVWGDAPPGNFRNLQSCSEVTLKF